MIPIIKNINPEIKKMSWKSQTLWSTSVPIKTNDNPVWTYVFELILKKCLKPLLLSKSFISLKIETRKDNMNIEITGFIHTLDNRNVTKDIMDGIATAPPNVTVIHFNLKIP